MRDVMTSVHERKSMASKTNGAVADVKCERRTMINLTKEQYEWVRKTAYNTNQSISAVIRMAVNTSIEQAKTG
jgi:hypothetical protein